MTKESEACRFTACRVRHWPCFASGVESLVKLLESLTQREREVAALVAEGLSNRAIAESLVVSSRTVEHHLESIFRKLSLSKRTQLALLVVATLTENVA